jgi:tetratricopeptide (TPR) repeat protein
MLDKLKSLFIVEEESKKETNPKTNTENKTEDKSTAPKTQPQLKGSLNEKIMDKLLGVLSANNEDGFDYIEYKNAIKALEKMPMDEKTKYRSAFATAQTIGVTVPKLLDSIAFYQKVLGKENNEFITALNHQTALKVGDKKKEIQDYTKLIENENQQIKKLTESINKHKEIINALKDKIEKDTVAIEQTRSDFETTYYKLMHQINEDISKINEYLK